MLCSRRRLGHQAGKPWAGAPAGLRGAARCGRGTDQANPPSAEPARAVGYLSCFAFCSRDLRSPITDMACQDERSHRAARHRAGQRRDRRGGHRDGRAGVVLRARPGAPAGNARLPTPARSRSRPARRTVSRLELWISFSSA